MALAELALTSRLSQEVLQARNFAQEVNARSLLSISRRMLHVKIAPRKNGTSGPTKARTDVSKLNATTSQKLVKLFQDLTDC